MYISLYRKYRPQTFSDMVGQSAAVSVLQLSLKEGRLGHAYLFSGPRGCGKTSAARLVAKTLNCLHPTDDCEPCGTCENCVAIALGEHLDVIEIDGASNRGIGEIRDLKSHVNLKPLSSQYKVYIIDEVHMLTEPAFNALLKTLEEPPANVVFLLATTEPHKVPVTIRSRCQHIPFHRISIEDMVSRIDYVAKEEHIPAEEEAVWELARQADGALRDALSLLEQAVALGDGSLTLASVNGLMSGGSRSELEKWIVSLRAEPETAAAVLNDMLSRGISLERLTESLFALFRDLWLYAAWGEKGAKAVDVSETELAFLCEEAKNWTVDKLKTLCTFLTRILPRTRYGMRQDVFAGMLMIEFTNIIEGKAPAYVPPQPQSPVQKSAPAKTTQNPATSHPPVDSTERLPWDDEFDAPPAAAKQHQVPKAQLPGVPASQSMQVDFVKELGEDDFASLLANIGPKALAFGAALLQADLYADEEKNEWSLEFTGSGSFAESFLNVPQNRRVLAEAIGKVWGIGAPANGSEAQGEEAPPDETRVAERTEKAGEKQETAGEMGTLLKMMGAEVLYIKDRNAIDENSEEHDG